MKKIKTNNMIVISMIAALYTTLCLALAPFSFGMVQVRVSEALTLLPIFSVSGIWGVTLGCGLSNLIGFFLGINPLGIIDIILGPLATFLAAAMTRRLGNIRIFQLPVAAAVPPVIVNAIIIGAELSLLIAPGESFWASFFLNAIYISIGQFLSCFLIGLPLVRMLEKTGVAKRCFGTGIPAKYK